MGNTERQRQDRRGQTRVKWDVQRLMETQHAAVPSFLSMCMCAFVTDEPALPLPYQQLIH